MNKTNTIFILGLSESIIIVFTNHVQICMRLRSVISDTTTVHTITDATRYLLHSQQVQYIRCDVS